MQTRYKTESTRIAGRDTQIIKWQLRSIANVPLRSVGMAFRLGKVQKVAHTKGVASPYLPSARSKYTCGLSAQNTPGVSCRRWRSSSASVSD